MEEGYNLLEGFNWDIDIPEFDLDFSFDLEINWEFELPEWDFSIPEWEELLPS